MGSQVRETKPLPEPDLNNETHFSQKLHALILIQAVQEMQVRCSEAFTDPIMYTNNRRLKQENQRGLHVCAYTQRQIQNSTFPSEASQTKGVFAFYLTVTIYELQSRVNTNCKSRED